MNTLKTTVLFALALALFSSNTEAQTYQYVDANGEPVADLYPSQSSVDLYRPTGNYWVEDLQTFFPLSLAHGDVRPLEIVNLAFTSPDCLSGAIVSYDPENRAGFSYGQNYSEVWYAQSGAFLTPNGCYTWNGSVCDPTGCPDAAVVATVVSPPSVSFAPPLRLVPSP